jgi:pimeloyl-ACP methyl ester carboxylesterase
MDQTLVRLQGGHDAPIQIRTERAPHGSACVAQSCHRPQRSAGAGDGAGAAGVVGTSLPPDFPVINDASLGVPIIGFGAKGDVVRTPIIFLHGNNDTPFPTACNVLGRIHDFAQFFADHGYSLSELWGLGYQGDQCDLAANPTNRSGVAHSTVANVPDLRRFVQAVLDYTGADQIDIVAHSLGVTLAREWMRQDRAYHLVRRFVAVDGPNHGIVNCSPSALNYFQLPIFGGFTPDSAVCQEYGSPDTPFLSQLNLGSETHGSTRILVIRNADTSFVYFSKPDGVFAPVPAEDLNGNPHDFSESATLQRAEQVDLAGQGQYDTVLSTAHLGILNSPETWGIAFKFLTDPSPRR